MVKKLLVFISLLAITTLKIYSAPYWSVPVSTTGSTTATLSGNMYIYNSTSSASASFKVEKGTVTAVKFIGDGSSITGAIDYQCRISTGILDNVKLDKSSAAATYLYKTGDNVTGTLKVGNNILTQSSATINLARISTVDGLVSFTSTISVNNIIPLSGDRVNFGTWFDGNDSIVVGGILQETGGQVLASRYCSPDGTQHIRLNNVANFDTGSPTLASTMTIRGCLYVRNNITSLSNITASNFIGDKFYGDGSTLSNIADYDCRTSTGILRTDLTNETMARIATDTALAISTTSLNNDIQTRLKKSADSSLNMNNYAIYSSSSISANEFIGGNFIGNGSGLTGITADIGQYIDITSATIREQASISSVTFRHDSSLQYIKSNLGLLIQGQDTVYPYIYFDRNLSGYGNLFRVELSSGTANRQMRLSASQYPYTYIGSGQYANMPFNVAIEISSAMVITGKTYTPEIQTSTITSVRQIRWADGSISTSATTAPGDNLGNHTATMPLNMNSFNINNVSSITIAGNAFSVGNSTLVVTNGRVGIGTITPTQLLHVQGTPYAGTGLLIIGNVGGGVVADFRYPGTGAGGITMSGYSDGSKQLTVLNLDDTTAIIRKTDDTNIGNIYLTSTGRCGINRQPTTYNLEVSGNAGKTVGGTAWVDLSDRRFKTDKGEITGVLDKIKLLRPIKYEWNEDRIAKYGEDPGEKFGFIAQELKEVFPNFVGQNSEGYYTYNPSGYEAVLTAAIKELLAEIEQLKLRIAELESK